MVRRVGGENTSPALLTSTSAPPRSAIAAAVSRTAAIEVRSNGTCVTSTPGTRARSEAIASWAFGA